MRSTITRASLLLALLAVIVAATFFPTGAAAAITNNPGNGNLTNADGSPKYVGTLSTAMGSSIPSPDVAAWLKKYVPAATNQLLILTECFGGNALAYIPAAANLAVLSATSQNQLAIYGGFDSGASGALKPYTPPALATSAQDVYNAGVASAIANNTGETPTVGGAGFLAPANFPLISTNANATTIQARQVLVYAGKPDGGQNTNDVFQLNTITTNFKGEANTTVTGIGTDSSAPWSGGPGTAAGLQMAILTAGSNISTSAIPNANQQLILFTGDHGGVRDVAAGLNRSAAGSATPTNAVTSPAVALPPAGLPATPVGDPDATLITSNFNTLQSMPVNANIQLGSQAASRNIDDIPCFSILLPLNDLDPAKNMAIADPVNKAANLSLTPPPNLCENPANTINPNNLSFFVLGLVNTANNAVLYYYSSLETTYIPSPDDLNYDEGLRVGFQITNGLNGLPIPSNNPNFASVFFGQTYNVYLFNFTANDYNVGEFAQDNPSIPAPEPATALIGALPLLMIMGRRRRGD